MDELMGFSGGSTGVRQTAAACGVGLRCCLGALLGLVACSASEGSLAAPKPVLSGAGRAPSTPVLDPTASGVASNAPGLGDLGAGSGEGNLDPTRVSSGCTTTLSGVTLDPAGDLPLYNVVVYVPSEPLEPLQREASCETCDGNFSGRPIAAAVSDASGAFTLDISNVAARPTAYSPARALRPRPHP